MNSDSDKPVTDRAYLRAARLRFLEGTGCGTPEEVVTKGLKSIREWCDIVSEERQLHNIKAGPETQNVAYA